jgi:hypothetical protein
MCGFVSDWLGANYATMKTPLTDLTRNDTTWVWGAPQETTFEELKRRVQEATKMHHMDYAHPIIVRTDASEIGIGAVLINVVDGVERTCGYISRKFTKTAQRWKTVEQEAYGLWYAVTAYKHLLLLGHRG